MARFPAQTLVVSILFIAACGGGDGGGGAEGERTSARTVEQRTESPGRPPSRAVGPFETRSVKNADGDVVALRVLERGRSEVYQELTGFSAQPNPSIENGELVDVNCDGHKDIMLMEFAPPGPNVPFLYWIFNPGSSRFECIPPAGSSMCSFEFPTIDCEKNGFVTENRSSASIYTTSTLQWQGSQLVTMREIERELQANGQAKVTVRERRNGRLEQTQQYIE